MGKFEFLITRDVYICFQTLFTERIFLSFRYAVNSFSQKFVILNDISREHSHSLPKKSIDLSKIPHFSWEKSFHWKLL